ncbi:MAG: hypothetical protein JWQ34_1598 [Mucilaginibacter sp.]|nr:hypothetical protein [Mucilaginibacter sp.]
MSQNSFFTNPLSAKGEERVDKQSDVGMSNRRQAERVPLTHPVYAALAPLFYKRERGLFICNCLPFTLKKIPHQLRALILSYPTRYNSFWMRYFLI